MASHLSPAIRLTIAEEHLFAAARVFAQPTQKRHTVATIGEMLQDDEQKRDALLRAAQQYVEALLVFKGTP